MTDGEIPIFLMFSGTVFYADPEDSLKVAPISWDKETRFRMPLAVWKDMMERYYPNSAWLCLRKDVFEELHRFKVEHGIPTWEQAIETNPRPSRGDGRLMIDDAVERIANAVLYEGYMLYPYRPSAVKNQQRFNFGVLYPREYCELQAGSDNWQMQTECLVLGPARDIARSKSSVPANGWNEDDLQEGVERDVSTPVTLSVSLEARPLRQSFRCADVDGELELRSRQLARTIASRSRW